MLHRLTIGSTLFAPQVVGKLALSISNDSALPWGPTDPPGPPGGTDSDSCTTPYFSYGGLFGIPGASTCNVATLPARVAAMASACCLSSDPNGAAPRQQCADFAAMNTDCGWTLGGGLGNCLACVEHNTNCDPEQDSDSTIIDAFCSGAAAAPPPPPPPTPGSTSSAPCQQGAGCTVVCAAKLMPLLNGPCAPLLRRLYDGVDGTYDGRAAVFDPITHLCQAMPTTTVIKGLAQLRESGECASHGISLNGLAEQSVGPVPPPPPPCTETMGSLMCSRAISSGVFSCAIDYCEACSGKGQCDTTCAFCTAAPPSPPAPPDTNCDIDSFQARSRRVTADCCDEPGHACVGGVASACDAKCATSYVEFFEQCQSAIGAFLPGRLHAFEALYATCTSLSAQVLLDTAVLCVPMGACNTTVDTRGAQLQVWPLSIDHLTSDQTAHRNDLHEHAVPLPSPRLACSCASHEH